MAAVVYPIIRPQEAGDGMLKATAVLTTFLLKRAAGLRLPNFHPISQKSDVMLENLFPGMAQNAVFFVNVKSLQGAQFPKRNGTRAA
jgi:hypothetical protein